MSSMTPNYPPGAEVMELGGPDAYVGTQDQGDGLPVSKHVALNGTTVLYQVGPDGNLSFIAALPYQWPETPGPAGMNFLVSQQNPGTGVLALQWKPLADFCDVPFFKAVSADYTLNALTDSVLVVDCSTGSRTVALPYFGGVPAGKQFTVIKGDDSGSSLTLVPNGGSGVGINGQSLVIVGTTQYATVVVRHIGNGAYVIVN